MRRHLNRDSAAPYTQTPAESADDVTRALLQHVHEQLRDGAGRLNIQALAARWGCPATEVLLRLSNMHRQGLFDHGQEAPYFRITPKGHALRQR